MSKTCSNRLFVALWIDPQVIQVVKRVQQRLKMTLRAEDIRWTRPEQMHLTLRFFGNISTSMKTALSHAIRTSTTGIRPFTCNLNRLGCFPNSREIRIIWVGIEEKQGVLHNLCAQLREKTANFGNAPDKRTFQPHLTIARIRRRNSPKRVLAQAIETAQLPPIPDWKVSEISLVQSLLTSAGSQYSTLESFPLQ